MADYEREGNAGFYRFNWKLLGVTALVDRIKAHSDGRITSSLTFSWPGADGKPAKYDCTLNLVAPRSRTELATTLGQTAALVDEGQWIGIIHTLCQDVIEAFRNGDAPEPLQFRHMSEKDQFLLHPFLLSHKPVVLFGDKGSSKSMFALYMLLLVENGESAPGLNLSDEKPRRTLYLDWESDKDDLNNRAALLAEGMLVRNPKPPLYRRCTSTLADDASQIAKIVLENNIELVVIDSIGPACSGDINDPQVALLYYQAIRRLGAVSTLGIGHISKEARRSKKKSVIGNVMFMNLARSGWEIRSDADEERADHSVVLFHHASNPTRRLGPQGFHLTFNNDSLLIEVEDPTTTFAEALSQTSSLLNFLKEGEKRNQEIAEYLEIRNSKQVDVLLARLRKRGQIEKRRHGVWGLVESRVAARDGP